MAIFRAGRPEHRNAWYLVPLGWFDALEVSDGTALFAALDNVVRFGFLHRPEGSNPTHPIGFARDRQPDKTLRVTKLRWYQGQPGTGAQVEPWIGLNCAACHTARMTYQDQSHTFDGGHSLIDFQSFVEQLDAGLTNTRAAAAKWDRFAATVLAKRDSPENRQMLQAVFDKLLAWQDLTWQMNETPLRYGAGRWMRSARS